MPEKHIRTLRHEIQLQMSSLEFWGITDFIFIITYFWEKYWSEEVNVDEIHICAFITNTWCTVFVFQWRSFEGDFDFFFLLSMVWSESEKQMLWIREFCGVDWFYFILLIFLDACKFGYCSDVLISQWHITYRVFSFKLKIIYQ